MFEKRWAMPNRRNNLISAFWRTSSLALLAWMLVAPIRTSGVANVSSRPDCHCRDSALPLGQPKTSLSAVMDTGVVLRMKALPFEDEEQDWAGALDVLRASFLIPCSFHKAPDRQSIAPRSALSFYPLRC